MTQYIYNYTNTTNVYSPKMNTETMSKLKFGKWAIQLARQCDIRVKPYTAAKHLWLLRNSSVNNLVDSQPEVYVGHTSP